MIEIHKTCGHCKKEFAVEYNGKTPVDFEGTCQNCIDKLYNPGVYGSDGSGRKSPGYITTDLRYSGLIGVPRATEWDFSEWRYSKKELTGYCVCSKYQCHWHSKKTVTDGPHNILLALEPKAYPNRLGQAIRIAVLETGVMSMPRASA